MDEKVPALYIGEHQVRLSTFGRPYFDGDRKPLSNLLLSNGDTLMVYPEEVYGKTLFRAPGSQLEPEFLGLGRIVKPEHNDLSERDLVDTGYIFHMPRNDFEPLIPLNKDTSPSKKKVAVAEKPAEEGGNN